MIILREQEQLIAVPAGVDVGGWQDRLEDEAAHLGVEITRDRYTMTVPEEFDGWGRWFVVCHPIDRLVNMFERRKVHTDWNFGFGDTFDHWAASYLEKRYEMLDRYESPSGGWEWLADFPDLQEEFERCDGGFQPVRAELKIGVAKGWSKLYKLPGISPDLRTLLRSNAGFHQHTWEMDPKEVRILALTSCSKYGFAFPA